MQITTDVLNALGDSRVEGNMLFLGAQLERKLYVRANKVLEAAGGKWNRKEKAHIFETDAADRIDQILMTGSIEIPRDEYNFFPSPQHIVDRMVKRTSPKPGDRVLEPEFGDARIIKTVMAAAPDAHITGVELNIERFNAAQNAFALSRNTTLIHADFLDYRTDLKFDVIIMNPPFLKRADIKHLNHALDLLAEGGRLDAIMPSSLEFRQDSLTVALRQRIKSLGGTITPLPEGTFKQSGTMVNTVIVEI